jgi:AraC family transcriptional regulator of adaptative response/methylated-DNA-[protein]-cysteine methyltransferase
MASAAAAPNWLAPLVDDMQRQPDLRLRDQDLRERGLDPVQVRRTFKRSFGMTFQAYQRACRLGTAMRSLHEGSPTLDAGLDAGFESDSGFRAAFARVFGDTPGQARGKAWLTATWLETPLGPMLAIGGDQGLELLEFVDRRALETELRELRRSLGPIAPGDHPVLIQTRQEVREYFEGTRQHFTLPLNQRGSVFQLKAWQALCRIPFGQTRSYSDMAREVGSPAAVRAIGRVNGQNRIAIVIPCHRVIRSDGSLCGYGGGRWRKHWLLEHERSLIASR